MSRDSIWQAVRDEVVAQAAAEPMLDGFLRRRVVDQPSLEAATAAILADRLAGGPLDAPALAALAAAAFTADPAVGRAIRADLACRKVRDPACRGYAAALLYLKGFHALQAYRVGHWLWGEGRKPLALYLQSRVSAALGVDIHPAARIGHGIMFDHATGIVIGETAVVDDNVSILHEVTLGGTGKTAGDRHPKVRSGVMIGAGAKILGNIVIGEGAKIGAGSVVLADVPPHTTVAGVPAKIVGQPASRRPALEMDQTLNDSSDG